MKRIILISVVSGAVLAMVAGCGGSGGSTSGSVTSPPSAAEPNVIPAFVKGPVVTTAYDGVTDDLLTAGLGKSGLAGSAPALPGPDAITPAVLRRLAIFHAYRAALDMTEAGGYGRLYGPNVDANGVATASEGRIAGDEFLAYSDDGTGRRNVTMLVQVPAVFDVSNPCVVATASPHYRGVYGGVPFAGEWGLKRGCAVAYTDKGAGVGASNLARNTSYTMQGIETSATEAGANFTTGLTEAERITYNTAFPNRWAIKHAHSRQNPEKDWGLDVLQATEFAFYALNRKFGVVVNGTATRRFTPSNTLVIAAGSGTGGAAALAAAEQDAAGYIDGVVAAQPLVQVDASGVTIRRGVNPVPAHGKSLLDQLTLANLLQPCAAFAPETGGLPDALDDRLRCDALNGASLGATATREQYASDVLRQLHAAGWEPESDRLHGVYAKFMTPYVAAVHANAYARASVKDNLCDLSFGGEMSFAYSNFGIPLGFVGPRVVSAAQSAAYFGKASGLPPMEQVGLLDNVVPVQPAYVGEARAPRCLRGLLTGSDGMSVAVRAGVAEVRRTGNLRGKPAVIVQGRADALAPPNHSARPYAAVSRAADATSRLAYVEVTNAQHFDAFIPAANLPGFDTRYVPLQRHFNQAMDLVWANLKAGAALPPSQLVRTTPRGGTPGSAPPLTAAHVPPIAIVPAAGDVITFSGATLTVPD